MGEPPIFLENGWLGGALWLDAANFETLIRNGCPQNEISLRLSLLTDFAKLYHNHFLIGFSLNDAPGFNEWALPKPRTCVTSSPIYGP